MTKEQTIQESASELWRLIYEDLVKSGVKFPNNFDGVGAAYGGYAIIGKYLSQEKEKCIKEEVFAFMHHLQDKANTLPPNLLLNEVVNYAYDRVSLLQNK